MVPAATLLQSGLEAVILIVIMALLANISWTLVFLPVVMILTAVFGLGIGFVAAVLNARYRDIEHLTSIVLNVLFFLVPIVYTPDLVPDTAYGLPVRTFIDINPLNSMITVARDAVYFLQPPSLAQLAIALSYAVVAFGSGWVYFRNRSMRISEEP